MTRKIATSSEIREHHRDFIVAPQVSPASSGSRLGAIRQDKTSFRRPLVDLKGDRTKRSSPMSQNFKTLYRPAQKGGRLGAPQDDWLPGTRTGPRHAGEQEAKQHGNYDRRGDKCPAGQTEISALPSPRRVGAIALRNSDMSLRKHSPKIIIRGVT